MAETMTATATATKILPPHERKTVVIPEVGGKVAAEEMGAVETVAFPTESNITLPESDGLWDEDELADEMPFTAEVIRIAFAYDADEDDVAKLLAVELKKNRRTHSVARSLVFAANSVEAIYRRMSEEEDEEHVEPFPKDIDPEEWKAFGAYRTYFTFDTALYNAKHIVDNAPKTTAPFSAAVYWDKVGKRYVVWDSGSPAVPPNGSRLKSTKFRFKAMVCQPLEGELVSRK